MLRQDQTFSASSRPVASANGLAVMALHKADPVMRDIPSSALTALAMKTDQEQSEVGGCEAIVAPRRYRALHTAIDRLPPAEPPATVQGAAR